MSGDPTLIADLVRAGLDAELVGRVANAIAATIVRDNVRDTVRAYETERKRTQRRNTAKSGGKQTMSAPDSEAETAPNVPDKAVRRCDLSSFLSSNSESPKRRTERKKEEQATRGTRMQPGADLPAECWTFARDQGFGDTQIAAMWREFVDFWIGVPGSRGLKLNWPATWRNRVRQFSAKKTGINGHGTGTSTMDAFDRLIAQADGDTEQGGDRARDITPGRA